MLFPSLLQHDVRRSLLCFSWMVTGWPAGPRWHGLQQTPSRLKTRTSGRSPNGVGRVPPCLPCNSLLLR